MGDGEDILKHIVGFEKGSKEGSGWRLKVINGKGWREGGRETEDRKRSGTEKSGQRWQKKQEHSINQTPQTN